jgi:predicted nucleic acid-binding protein
VFVVDTNIFVYAADEDSALYGRCRELLEDWRRQTSAWYLTWGIVYEFLRVEAIFSSPSLGILVPAERHSDVASEVIKSLPSLSGNLLYDAQTAILMREHGIKRIYTRDTDFHRFPFLEPIDPTA